MFTGLVEAVGTVSSLRRHSAHASLEVAVRWTDDDPPRIGDSVAVNGACLTVVATEPTGFATDISAETLERTLLGRLNHGNQVNLERAVRLGQRLGGHLVQGHVDGVARVLHISREGSFARWRISLPPKLARQVAEKGSIAVHGVSLTIASVDHDSFEVALIPETLEQTVLGTLRVGSELHLETDVLAKYVTRALENDTPSLLQEVFGSTGRDA